MTKGSPELVFGAAPGDTIGTSRWVTIDQAMISRFGETTLDPDPLHVDVEWARHNSPFGGTVAFGFLTVSLLTHLFWSATSDKQSIDAHYVNYGFDRLRLVAPVPAGARIRGHFTSLGTGKTREGVKTLRIGCVVEIEGQARPALVADWVAARIETDTHIAPQPRNLPA